MRRWPEEEQQELTIVAVGELLVVHEDRTDDRDERKSEGCDGQLPPGEKQRRGEREDEGVSVLNCSDPTRPRKTLT